MPHDRSRFAEWLRREWFLVLVVSFAMVLGLAQVLIERAFRPPVLVLVAAGAISVAAWFGFVCAVLGLRQRLYDLRYRWLTRGVDRAMRQTNRKANR